jgi:hypothetical protein
LPDSVAVATERTDPVFVIAGNRLKPEKMISKEIRK